MFVSGGGSRGSSLLRKGAVLMAGGGVYGVTAYMTYIYLQPPPVAPATIDDNNGSNENNNHPHGSCVHHPLRTKQFEKVASCYDTSIGRDEFFMGINVLRRALLYFHARGTCLEVGAGTARNLPYYPRGTRVLLTDQSEQMLQQAAAKIKQYNSTNHKNAAPRFALLPEPQDAASLDGLPSHAFDTVIDTFGLCSYDDPAKVLREMVRLCKPDGGKILLLEHGRSHSWPWVTRHLDRTAERHAALWGCVWNRDLDALLEQVSDVLEVQILRTWHFGTTYYIVCRPKRTTATNLTIPKETVLSTTA